MTGPVSRVTSSASEGSVISASFVDAFRARISLPNAACGVLSTVRRAPSRSSLECSVGEQCGEFEFLFVMNRTRSFPSVSRKIRQRREE